MNTTELVYRVREQDAELNFLRAEVARLKVEGTPGVLHEVDKAFYNLTVKERDTAHTLLTNLRVENDKLRRVIAERWLNDEPPLQPLGGVLAWHESPASTGKGGHEIMPCSYCNGTGDAKKG